MATPPLPQGYKLVPDDGRSVVPEARGKSAAHDRWMAQGGRPGKDGKFKRGPMNGMTYDQALQKFETMWATAPDSIKDKYAGRSKTDLAPSERESQLGTPAPKSLNESLNAALPGETATQTYARQRAERMGTPPPAKPSLITQSPAVTAPAPIASSGPDQVGADARRLMGGSAVQPVSTANPAPAPPGLSPLAQREFDRRSNAVAATPTGQPLVNQAQAATAGVNRLTGLPMGFVPGDKVTSSDPALKARADQSVARQQIADSKAAMAPRAIPASTPAPLRDQRAAAVADYQSDLDPAKFEKINQIYNRGTDLEKAQMVGDSLARRGVPAATPAPPRGASPAVKPPRPMLPGSTPARFAMARR